MARLSSHDVRDRLLEAGVQVIGKLGFNGCSVQDITEAAGVPKGSFYNHFESKEALGAAALKYFWADGASEHMQILSQPDLSPRQRLQAYFTRASEEMVRRGFTCGCLVGNMAAELSDRSEVITAQLSEIFTVWSREVAACIGAAQAAGEIRLDVEPDMLAVFVLNAWEGAVLRARIEKAERPLRHFTETLGTILFR